MSDAPTALSDDQLWQRSRAGDREAFGKIVARYQPLVCSLAYSACGNLARSEDLGQEAFLIAWRDLGELRDPTKLRAWLCGIVRNLTANAMRRERRRGGDPEPLDSMAEPLAPDADPETRAATREEATRLWKSLVRLPVKYREPMVLFYRQGQSIAEVALSLELSEEAVKQRLSRGRSMLREELAAIVETTLARSRPSRAFTAAVLAALPLSTPHAGAAVAAGMTSGKGAAAVEGGVAGYGLGTVLGPAIGLYVGMLGARAAASTARSEQERSCVVRHARRLILFCFAMSLGLVVALSQLEPDLSISPGWIVAGIFGWVALLVSTVTVLSSRMQREVLRIRVATRTDDASLPPARERRFGVDRPAAYESKWRLLGLPVIAVRHGSPDAGRLRPAAALGWIAIGDAACSPLLAIGGFAVAPIAVGAVTVGILSLSLWGAALGVLAFGSFAVGFWAYGLGALGWRCAVGAAAVARDFAVGMVARAAEANTPAAKEWLATQWLEAPLHFLGSQLHWLVLLILLVAVTLGGRSSWKRRAQ